MPRPKKESEASTRIAEPSWAVSSTISGASVLGSTWRTAMRTSPMPTARAASTKGCSRSDRVDRFARRAPRSGTSGMAMAMMVFQGRAQCRRHDQGQDQEGQGLHDVHEALQRGGRSLAADIAADQADRPAQAAAGRVAATPTGSEMRAP